LDDAAKADIGRALGRASADYFLRTLDLLRRAHGGNLMDALIVIAVSRGNLHQYRGDEAFDRTYAAIDTPPPDELRRPVSIRGMAEFLDLPYETVRRNMLRLVAKGVLRKQGGGFVVPTGVLLQPMWEELIRANTGNVERLLRSYDRLTEEPAKPASAKTNTAA
jgi:hypothetical protein